MAGKVGVLTLQKNAGKGEAVRQGLKLALERGAAWVGYADADLSTPVHELLRMLASIESDPVDALLGSRVRLLGTSIERQPLRHYLGRAFATLSSLALQMPVYDTQCGAKLFRRTDALLAALAAPFGSRWIFDVELLARLMAHRDGATAPLTFRELPLKVWRDVGGSKLKPGSMVWASLQLLALMVDLRLDSRRSNKETEAWHRKAAVQAAFAIVAGVAVALWIFPLDFVSGAGKYWSSPRGDVTNNLIGLRYFLADAWHFPLFQTLLLVPPHGINIIFTDSLPLFALPAKLARPLIPEGFNYFGLWFLLAWIAQPVSAACAMRSAGIRDALPVCAMAMLALLAPVWWFRYPHATLCGHFLILFGLAMYFRIRGAPAKFGTWALAGLLACVGVLVHAYLLLVIVALLGAGAAAALFEAPKKNAGAAAGLSGVLLLVGALAYVSGYFHGMGSSSGFGHYSMNLWSPIIPQRSGIFGAGLPIVDATGGQYEGYNYLGLGVLLLIAAALVVRRGSLAKSLRRQWSLILALAVFTALALSNKVYAGHKLLLDVGHVPLAFEQIRSSGRLFWVVGYALSLASVAVVWSSLRPLMATLVLACAVCLQFVDSRPARALMFAEIRAPPSGQFKRSAWISLIAAHRKLTIVPTISCAGSFASLELLQYASFSATPSNNAYLARSAPGTFDCVHETSAATGGPEDGELLVLLSPPLSQGRAEDMESFGELCRRFEAGFACTRRWSNLPPDLVQSFPPALPRSFYRLGETVTFNNKTDRHFLRDGWSSSEPWGTWSDGASADLRIPFSKHKERGLTLSADALGYGPDAVHPRRLQSMPTVCRSRPGPSNISRSRG
jgi:hypothetical protein